MDFKDIISSRYSVKEFNGEAIPEEKVNELLEYIRLSPSSFNIQPWKIKVISDKEMKEKLTKAAWDQKQVSSCSHLLVFCADTRLSVLIDNLEKSIPNNSSPGAKAYIKMIRDFESSLSPEEKKSWGQKQVYIALTYSIIGARELGFHSSPMEGFSPEEVSKVLNLPEYLVPTVLCALGNPADKPRQRFRFPLDDILI